MLVFFSAAGPAGRLYLVPWEELQERLAAWKAGTGLASIALEELQGRPAIVQGRGAAFDYLAAVAQLDATWYAAAGGESAPTLTKGR